MGPSATTGGFTLVEISMVITLVGILAFVATPYFIDLRDDAKSAITKDELAALKRAISGDGRAVAGGTYTFAGYESDMGKLPTTLADLVLNPNTGNTTRDYDPLTRRGWRGPYVDSSTESDYSKDAWSTAYVYSTSPRFIRSWGPDKADDSGGDDDITVTY